MNNSLKPHEACKYCTICGNEVEVKSEIHLRCNYCNKNHFVKANPATAGIILCKDEVLMIKRAIEPHKGTLAFPGGMYDPGESDIETTLIRELQEEIGLSIPAEQLNYWESKKFEYEYQGILYPNISFALKIHYDVKPQVVVKDEITEVMWFKVDEVPIEQIGFPIVKARVQKLQHENNNY